jgi:hypothetical protein
VARKVAPKTAALDASEIAGTLTATTDLQFLPRLIQATKDGVAHTNHATWIYADDYVFASSEAVLRRVAAYFPDDDGRRAAGGGVTITGVDDF